MPRPKRKGGFGRLTAEAVQVCLNMEPRLVPLLLTRYSQLARVNPFASSRIAATTKCLLGKQQLDDAFGLARDGPMKKSVALLCLLLLSSLAACNLPVLRSPASGAAPTPSPVVPFVLNSPLDDTSQVFMNTYYGAIGAAARTPQNPNGIHLGIDLVAPAGTPIKAVASGIVSRITIETKTESDGTLNTYANLILSLDDHNSVIYIFEPLATMLVKKGQRVAGGDVLGTLADNRGQNLRHTLGTGTLDIGLMSCAGGSCSRVCFIPYTSPAFKTRLETWFSRAYTPTAEHPGPCTCHYRYP
jgi:hypothetical protein